MSTIHSCSIVIVAIYYMAIALHCHRDSCCVYLLVQRSFHTCVKLLF